MRSTLALVTLLVAACGPAGTPVGPQPDAGPDTPQPQLLTLAPANAVVSIVDGVAATQEYVATATYADGTQAVVPDVAIYLGDTSLGTFSGTVLTPTGLAAGVTTVTATIGG